MMPLDLAQYPVPFAHGFAVIDRDGRCLYEQGDVERVFPLASVTKLLTAMATHLAAQEQRVALAQPAGPQGSTLVHLLSHASGLAPEGDGSAIKAPPETARIYSDQGYDVIQAVMEHNLARPFAQWLEECLLQPLGAQSLSVPTSAAWSGLGNVMDLSLIAQELLTPELLTRASLEAVSKPVFPTLRGIVPGYGMQRPSFWGMGAEVRGEKTPHWTAPNASPQTFGHFGIAGSFLWVDPALGVAAIFLGERPFGQWHKANWPAMNQAVLEALP